MKNDAPFAMEITVSVTLINTITGASTLITAHDAAMDAGAGHVQWFCPGGANTTTDAAEEASTQHHHAATYIQH